MKTVVQDKWSLMTEAAQDRFYCGSSNVIIENKTYVEWQKTREECI